MPMVQVQLTCGCPVIVRYEERASWMQLTPEQQARVRATARKDHIGKCAAKQNAASRSAAQRAAEDAGE